MSDPSFAQTTSLTCPRCGKHFEASIWLILDATARPDLLAQAQEGTLHHVTCPHCGHVAQVDAPCWCSDLTPTPRRGRG